MHIRDLKSSCVKLIDETSFIYSQAVEQRAATMTNKSPRRNHNCSRGEEPGGRENKYSPKKMNRKNRKEKEKEEKEEEDKKKEELSL